jgi:hypothetical protein
LVEGYKFCNGDIRRLTRPQYHFLAEVSRFKAEAKSGKKGEGGQGQPAQHRPNAKHTYEGTPEQLAAILKPKFDKMDADAKAIEIARAKAIMKDWEEKLKNPPK